MSKIRFPIIGITGLKGHGKDTAAGYFTDNHFSVVKFAAPLKAMVHSLLTIQGCDEETAERMINGDLKENRDSQYLQNCSPRQVQQTLGTEWGRDLIGSELWVKAAQNAIDHCRKCYDGAVVTDLRFHNELWALQNMGARTLRIVRPALIEQGLKDVHPSEIAIMKLDVDAEIINDGTVQDLYNKVSRWFRTGEEA